MFDQAPHLGFTWTLATEEQFYLVWPLLLIILLYAGLSRRAILIATCTLCLAVIMWRAGLVISGSIESRVDTSPDLQADGLMIGCIAAQIQYLPRFRLAVRHPWSLSPDWRLSPSLS